ncbi:MAG: ABC transporter substrate-binding protein [Solirubrobacterales bacterium]|nr:ABC transporter substrate-binding protein [Solirubrobacterales bacterium]
MRSKVMVFPALLGILVIGLLAGCGGSSSSSGGGGGDEGTPVDGGILRAAINDNPDHIDPALSYTSEGWQILEATNNGLLSLKKASGAEGNKVVPDIAEALPKISDDGKTYTFKVRRGVKFSPPVNRDVKPSDFKFSIERLFRVNSGGLAFYKGIVGADEYAKTRKGGISGIIADDKKGTITFKLTEADGTFPMFMAIPFAYALPKGTPDKDISSVPDARVATGPYMVTSYTPKQKLQLRRNPSFKEWTDQSPNGHLDGIDIAIGVDPDAAVNMTVNGDLDWYFTAVPPARLTQLKAQYGDQVNDYQRNNITYFFMNERKAPFDDLRVRQAVNYATDRDALVKIFGGQGEPTENIVPPPLKPAYKKHEYYPYDLAKAKQLIKQAGVEGTDVSVWTRNQEPFPKATQYMASVLNQIGLNATVRVLDQSIYDDTISNQKTDPQIGINDWSQDYPEAGNFIDTLLNGNNIVSIGNNNQANADVPALNAQIEKANRMPLGDARDRMWAELDSEYMKQNAPLVPFLNASYPKFNGPNLRGLVFNPTYFELFPSMWLEK